MSLLFLLHQRLQKINSPEWTCYLPIFDTGKEGSPVYLVLIKYIYLFCSKSKPVKQEVSCTVISPPPPVNEVSELYSLFEASRWEGRALRSS